MEDSFEVGMRQTLYHKRLRELRERSGMDQRSFAKAAGIEVHAFMDIEKLRRYPDESQAEAIASYLDVDTRDLFPRWAASVVQAAQAFPRDASAHVTRVMLESPETLRLEAETDPQKDADASLLSEKAAEFLGLLSPRMQKLVRMRFGISPETHVHTLAEVGREIGVTPERVRQMEAKALKTLEKSREGVRMRTFLEETTEEYVLYQEWLHDEGWSLRRQFEREWASENKRRRVHDAPWGDEYEEYRRVSFEKYAKINGKK